MRDDDDSVSVYDRVRQAFDTRVGSWVRQWNHWRDCGALDLPCSSSILNYPFAHSQEGAVLCVGSTKKSIGCALPSYFGL